MLRGIKEEVVSRWRKKNKLPGSESAQGKLLMFALQWLASACVSHYFGSIVARRERRVRCSKIHELAKQKEANKKNTRPQTTRGGENKAREENRKHEKKQVLRFSPLV